MDRERREGLDNLADELIDNIIRTPDEEILNEVKEDCGDSAHDANRVRDLLDKSKRKIRLEKIKKAFTHPFAGGSVTDDVLWLTSEINKADKEIEFRNGVMNRQKSALDEKHKEIERLRKALKDILKEDLQKGEEMYQLVKRTRHIAFGALKEDTRESKAIEG